MSNFLELVAKERTRQIVEKGYTAEHDDEHTDGSIADAGACYAATEMIYQRVDIEYFREVYKWDLDYFTKSQHDRKEQLVIAASLIMAEYDRILRAEQKTKKDFMDSIDEMYD